MALQPTEGQNQAGDYWSHVYLSADRDERSASIEATCGQYVVLEYMMIDFKY